jgi:Transposase DDE domain group 1
MQTECISGQLEFEGFDGRRVVAAFDGGAVTSDAGALLLRETDRAIRLIERVAACFSDGRDPGQLIQALPTLVGQRIVAIALGKMSTTTTGYASIRCWRYSATASRPSATTVRRWRARAR